MPMWEESVGTDWAYEDRRELEADNEEHERRDPARDDREYEARIAEDPEPVLDSQFCDEGGHYDAEAHTEALGI